MPSSQSLGVPLWVDDAGDTAQAPFRTIDVGTRSLNVGTAAANQVNGGVYPGGGAMAVTAGTGMTVKVAAGYCCVPNSSGGLQGGYLTGLMTSVSLDIAAADPGNGRIDLVCVTVNDLGSSASGAVVQVLTGTPAGTPAAPALPANSLALATVAVGAGVSVPGTITDQRAWTVPPGGILPITSPAAAPAVPASQFMIDLSTGSLVQGTGTAGSVAQLPVLAWPPVVAVQTTPVNDSAAEGTLTTIVTATITCDGSTDIDVYYKWAGLMNAAAPALVTMQVALGGTVLDQTVIGVQSASVYGSGGAGRVFTSPGQGNTPAPGTHTVTFAFQSATPSATTTVKAAAAAAAMLRIAPAAA